MANDRVANLDRIVSNFEVHDYTHALPATLLMPVRLSQPWFDAGSGSRAMSLFETDYSLETPSVHALAD